MNRTLFDDIKTIRHGQEARFMTDCDRYSVVVDEPNGSHTAYYFSTPIFNNNGKIVERKFNTNDKNIYFDGSNATIKVMRDIVMESDRGYCIVKLNGIITYTDEFEIRYEKATVFPTMNGVAIKAICSSKSPFIFSISSDKSPYLIKANNRTIAYMSDEFSPLFTISAIGMLKNNYVVESANISYEEIGDKDYCVSVFPNCEREAQVLFEINYYEPKLFHDTTVESKHPFMKNPFGSVAYVGTTPYTGEQWLYSRLDNSKIFSLTDKAIMSARLYIPKLCRTNLSISLFRVSERFCSMGSDWDSKILPGQLIVDSFNYDKYIVIDLSSELTETENSQLLWLNGVVMKPKKSSTSVVLSTADNYIFPQIFAINYFT